MKTHNDLVRAFVDVAVGDGYANINYDGPGSVQKDFLISLTIDDFTYDIVARRGNEYLVAECETSSCLFSAHTRQQMKHLSQLPFRRFLVVNACDYGRAEALLHRLKLRRSITIVGI